MCRSPLEIEYITSLRSQRSRILRDRSTVQSAIQRNDGLRPEFVIREPNHIEELSQHWCQRCACVHISPDGLCPFSGVAYRHNNGRNEYDSNDDDSESEIYDAASENITDERTAVQPHDDTEPSSDDQDIGELSIHVYDRPSDPDNLHEYPLRLGLARRATGRFPVGRWAGGPVGRWAELVGWLAGDQQKYYDILFLLVIDVINYNKNRIVQQGL